MSELDLPDDQLAKIAEIKQKYWTAEGIAQEYHFYALSSHPITRAKNITELGLVWRYVLGPLVLDAGAGTGRFTFPLQQAGCTTIALDISLEMLGEGLRVAGEKGRPFTCLVGDIGHLPFPDNTFDSVVSMTVLRHFPQWTKLLGEYVRVVRPGGRILFDMASGDQRVYLEERGIPNPARRSTDAIDPIAFEQAVTMKELLAIARENGCAVLTTTPYDFFNTNRLLDHILGDSEPAFERAVHALLETEGGIIFHELVTRHFLAALSPAVCPSWIIVLEKGSSRGYEPGYRQLRERDLAGHKTDALATILKKCLGQQFPHLLSELGQVLENVDAQRLMAVCWQELLPHLPIEILCWEAD